MVGRGSEVSRRIVRLRGLRRCRGRMMAGYEMPEGQAKVGLVVK